MTLRTALRGSAGIFLLPACFIVEVILGGPLGVYGGVPVRYILFGASCAVLTLPVLVRGRVARIRVPAIASIAGFLIVNAVWTAVIPILTGGKFPYALGEARAFVALVLVILVLAVARRGRLPDVVRRLQRIVVATATVLALVQVGIWVVGTLLSELQWAVRLGLVWLYDGAENSLYVGPMPDGFFRVFWISSLWCLLAIFWLPVAVRRPGVRMLLRIVLLFGLFVTYSRGIWLGAVVGLLVVQVAQLTALNFVRTMTRAAVTAVLVLSAVAGALAATGEFERGLGRFTSTTSSEDPSITVRLDQAHYLSELWSEHELLGGGYGAYHPRYQRSETAPFSYEHMPYAFLAKLGLVGVMLNAAFLLFWGLTAWRARMRAPTAVASFLGGMVAFLVATMTNPMIINLVGMSILGCLLLQWAAIRAAPEEFESCSASSGVYVVLSTYNGAQYVAALIESVQRQTFRDWCLLVRDDGSSDATVEIVAELARRDPRIRLLPPDGNLRAPGSFGVLLAAARERGARCVFLADQDDVWLEGKLARLLAAMSEAEASAGPGVPVLVYSDLVVVASDLRVVHPSFRRQQGLRLSPSPAALRTLLAQNVVTGCVSLLNRALLDVVVPIPEGLAMHDWWTAQCAAATGAIIDVDEPTVLYRQHAANVVGAKGVVTMIRTVVREPGRWWARSWRNFLLGLYQARALARRLQERPVAARARAARDLVAEYCAAFGPASTRRSRLRAVRRLGVRPVTAIPRLLYYARVLLYAPDRSALNSDRVSSGQL